MFRENAAFRMDGMTSAVMQPEKELGRVYELANRPDEMDKTEQTRKWELGDDQIRSES